MACITQSRSASSPDRAIRESLATKLKTDPDVGVSWLGVEHQAPAMRLFNDACEHPPLPLARLRMREQMVEILQNSLRFSPNECWNPLEESFIQEVRLQEVFLP